MKKFIILLLTSLLLFSCGGLTQNIKPAEEQMPIPVNDKLQQLTEQGQAVKVRPFTARTGGGTGALDALEESTLVDGDLSLVFDTTTNDHVYFYEYVAADTSSENDPEVIYPDDRGATGAHLKLFSGSISQANCSGITEGMCMDIDNGKLYSYDGDSVEFVGGLGVATNGQIPIGNGTSEPTLAVIIEAGDALIVTNESGEIEFSAHANLEALADADTVGHATPGTVTYDNNATGDTGTSYYYGTALSTDDAVVLSMGVEESDGTTQDYMQYDGVDEVIKTSRTGGYSWRMYDIDTSSADYTVTTELGSNLEDWNGVWLMTTHTSGNYDVVLPDCDTPMNVNGVSMALNKYDGQITVCQKNLSETVQVVSASALDYFVLRDNTSLSDGYELNSSGGANRYMCVLLACAPIAGGDGVWVVINETGGTDAIDPSWVTGADGYP